MEEGLSLGCLGGCLGVALHDTALVTGEDMLAEHCLLGQIKGFLGNFVPDPLLHCPKVAVEGQRCLVGVLLGTGFFALF